jgi:5-methyltetrahydrofolate--homocysteine methyltransferase
MILKIGQFSMVCNIQNLFLLATLALLLALTRRIQVLIMIIIGEKLNSSVPATFKAYEIQDESYFIGLAKKQEASGANYIDVNAGAFEDEEEKLLWAAGLVKGALNNSFVCLDSVTPKALKRCLGELNLPSPLINSISLESDRFEETIRLVQDYNTSIIALPISDDGIPESEEERYENSVKLLGMLAQNGISHDRIHLDILVFAASADWEAPLRALNTTKRLREEYPEIHLTAGLSNVSYGLPKRQFINRAMLTAAVTAGLDSVIMDPTKPEYMMNLAASLAVSGQDPYLANYIEVYRRFYEEE